MMRFLDCWGDEARALALRFYGQALTGGIVPPAFFVEGAEILVHAMNWVDEVKIFFTCLSRGAPNVSFSVCTKEVRIATTPVALGSRSVVGTHGEFPELLTRYISERQRELSELYAREVAL